MRNILADKPRVTKFPVEFDPPPDGLQHLAAPDPVEAAAAAQTEMDGMEVGAVLVPRATVRVMRRGRRVLVVAVASDFGCESRAAAQPNRASV